MHLQYNSQEYKKQDFAVIYSFSTVRRGVGFASFASGSALSSVIVIVRDH